MAERRTPDGAAPDGETPAGGGRRSLPPEKVRRRATLRQRALARAIAVASGILSRLPPGPMQRLAHLAGVGWYLAAPAQRDLARANLRRVCTWLDEQGTASPRVRRAAHDPAALERLLRDAFGHRARYYLEVAMNARFDPPYLAAHMALADPELAERVLGQPGPMIVIGLHMGALELPAQYITVTRGRHAVAPMETLPNAPLQAYLERSRSRTGVEIVPTSRAREALERAIERGDIVGLIADRDVSGRGVPVTLFGAPARLPVGPGVLAVTSGVPVLAAAAIRVGYGEYRGTVIPLEVPATGSRHERARQFLESVARAFERLIAEAPEQWWSIFQPIWGQP